MRNNQDEITLKDFPMVFNRLRTASAVPVKALHKFIFEDDKGRNNRKFIRGFTGFSTCEVISVNKKKEYVADNLSQADLVSICNLLNLNYNNNDLVSFIYMNLTKGQLLKDSINDDDDDDDVNAQLHVNQTDDDDDGKDDENNSDSDSTDSSASSKKKKKNRPTCSHNYSRFPMTFRDVEDSIQSFDGTDAYSITRWIEDFEEISLIMRWDDIQKLVFGKKSLKGLAKIFIQSQRGVTSWECLKKLLLREFEPKMNSAKLHKMLTERKWQRGEPLMEYWLKMKEIASRGNIEDQALMEYVIDSIQDDGYNKLLLYGSQNLDEFKIKLQTYESIKNKNLNKITDKCVRNDKVDKRKFNVNQNSRMINNRCFNCGLKGHKSKDCNQKDKGTKCFKCNQYGHIANNCNSVSQIKSNVNTNVNVCANFEDQRMYKSIIINKKQVKALVDTGSQINIIRENIYKLIGKPKLDKTSILLTGFGQNRIRPYGYFNATIEVDGCKCDVKMYVVSNDCMDMEAIIGNEFISEITQQAEVKITNDGILINAIHNECNEVKAIMNINLSNEEIDVDLNAKDDCRKEVLSLIYNYEPDKTKDTDIKMNIVLSDDKPIYHQPRRLPFIEREIVDKTVEEWLTNKIIEPCSSEFASPVVVTKKKDGSPRICIDYRKINRVIIKDRYPLPLIEDQLDRLQKSKIFSTLDLKNGFFHVDIDDRSKKYTSFVTHNGQYQFLKVPFGLCNSPAIFQRYINTIFKDLTRDDIVLPYMDDFIIPARDDNEAVDRLKTVLNVARQFGLEINKKKCSFLKRTVEFLGYVINDGRIYPSPKKIEAVVRFPKPTTIKQVQSFLGLSGYFRKFIPNYAIISKPLSDMLKKNAKFQFNDEQQKSFNDLKQILSEKPVLSIYQQNCYTELHTDASADGYGAILMQKSDKDSKLHPVYYMSKKTTAQEKKYTSYELEILAVVEALKKFRIYLLGIPFTIITDCNAFQKTMDKKDLTTRVARWTMLLEEFNYKIEHRSGSSMRHVDALSRYPIMIIQKDGLLLRIKKCQDEDDDIKSIKSVLKFEAYDDYFIKNELLYKTKDGYELLVVPRIMQSEIIRRAHQNGHFSVKKTEELIKKDYFIPGLRNKIEKLVSNCVPCILVNRKRGKQEGELHPLFKDELPLYTYHIDHLGPLESTSKRYKHVFAVMDGFTKFVWLYPTKTTSAKEVIDRLEQQKIIFGNPNQIISDRGSAFTSSEFENYCKDENIKHIKITTGLPRANGQIERLNSIIIAVLSKLSIDDPTKWYKYVYDVQRIINSTYQRSIQTTPFELMIGTEMRNKEDLKLKELIETEMRTEFNEIRHERRSDAKRQILKIQDENRRTFNKKRKKPKVYRVNDVVIKRTQQGPGVKLKTKFLGPYKVVRVKNNNTYDVLRDVDGDGPISTTSCAEYMKPFLPAEDIYLSSGADEEQNGRTVGNEI